MERYFTALSDCGHVTNRGRHCTICRSDRQELLDCECSACGEWFASLRVRPFCSAACSASALGKPMIVVSAKPQRRLPGSHAGRRHGPKPLPSALSNRKPKPCKGCGCTMTRYSYGQLFCSKCWATCRDCGAGGATRGRCKACKSLVRSTSGRRRRAVRALRTSEPYTSAQVYARDKGRCGLCGKPVRKTSKRRGDPNGPSIDHILPLSKGGNDVLANVQLAHLGCNAKKRDRVWGSGEQLRLVG